MFKVYYKTLLLASAAFTLLGTSTLHAQSVDYGALEQLFGEPVTTAATGKPQKASEVPVDMDIITQDDIRRSGADNIPDILQFVTGLNVERESFASVSVGIHGYNQPTNPRLLVLVNGRQVYLDDFGYVEWAAIPVQLDEIRQIEVVKGPNSALFGFNAVSGVINIVTYDPLYDKVNSVSVTAGSQHLAEGSVVSTTHIGDIAGIRLSAGGFTATEFDHPPVTDMVEPLVGSVAADSKVKLSTDIVWGVTASAANVNSFLEAPFGWPLAAYWRTNSFGTNLTAETSIGTLDFNAYRNEERFNLPLFATNWLDDVYIVQASDLVKLGTENTVRLNLEYRYNAITSGTSQNNDAGTFGGLFDYYVISGGAMWNWDILPSLSLTNAVRIDSMKLHKSGDLTSGFTLEDYDSQTITTMSYNSGLVYKYSDNDTFRITAARGIQAPSPVESAFATSGNPNITPTTVGNYALGYDRQLSSITSVMRTDVFYQTQKDILANSFGLTPIITPDGMLHDVSENIGSSTEKGASIELRGHSISGWRWNASYSFASIDQTLITNKGPHPTNSFDFAQGTPQHTVVAGLGYSIGKWEFDGQGLWESKWVDYKGTFTTLYVTPVWSRDNLTTTVRIGYKVTDHLTISGTADQLNQSSMINSSAIPIERRFFAKVAFTY